MFKKYKMGTACKICLNNFRFCIYLGTEINLRTEKLSMTTLFYYSQFQYSVPSYNAHCT